MSSIALSSFPANTSLQYAVTASNVAGESGYSALSAQVNIPPGPPTNVTTVGSNLSWTAPTSGANFYKVYVNDTTNFLFYLSTVSTAVAFSNLFVGSNIRYSVTANGNTSGESAYSVSSPSITVSFDQVPDNSVNGSNYVDTLLGVGTNSSNFTQTLQENTSKFDSPIINAGQTDVREIVNSNLIAPGFTLSSFASSATTFLAISSSQTVVIPSENLPGSNSLFYIPTKQGDAFTLSVQGRPYSIESTGVSTFSIQGQTKTLGDIFQIGGRLYQYAAVGSLILLGQGFQSLPSSPSIYIRPKCSNQTITYSWLDSAISTFSLVLESYSTYTLPYFTTSYTVTGLSNGRNYSAYIQNTDGNTSSLRATFRTVQPGNKPSIIESVTGNVDLSLSTVNLSWTPPASDGGATIGWYVIKDTVSTLKYNTYGTETSITIPFVGLSSFSIQAVNDPGYSPASTIQV